MRRPSRSMPRWKHTSADQPVDLDHNTPRSAPGILQQSTSLLPRRRGPLPLALDRRDSHMRQDPAILLATTSTQLQLTTSIGTYETKRESLGAAPDHGDAGEPSEDGKRPRPSSPTSYNNSPQIPSSKATLTSYHRHQTAPPGRVRRHGTTAIQSDGF
jgi:hypothetical protein